MAPSHERPSTEMIDSWLNSRLSSEEDEIVEAYFQAHSKEFEDSFFPEEILKNLPSSSAHDPELEKLISHLKTQGPLSPPAPTKEDWREILKPSSNPALLGTLGEYEVTEVIATGGMGIVFKAYDPELKRTVALKVLSPALAANTTDRERFLSEAQSVASLEHENILPIYGVQADAVPWFAMKYVAGGSLQTLLDEGHHFGISELKSITRQVAEALHAAHQAYIIHRDIKPDNILIDSQKTRLWVCDFGIARSPASDKLTQTGSSTGTPQYMSPEQAAGETVDTRSDLFSLGLVLYHCASGKPAFPIKTATAALHTLKQTTPEPLTGQPEWFINLIARLLEKKPKNRPAHAGEILKIIDQEMSYHSKSGKRSHLIVLLAVASVILFGQFFWKTSPAPLVSPPEKPAPQSIAPITIQETGEKFTDLDEATMAAPPESTLILRGRIQCRKEIITPRHRSLNFRSAKGTQAVIFTKHPTKHALFINGPATVSGIRFERIHPGRSALPILGINGRQGNIHVSNCHFQSAPINEHIKGHRGLCVTDYHIAKIKNCTFEIPGGQGLLTGSHCQDLFIDNCNFIADAAIEHRARFESAPLNININSCVIFTNYFMIRGSRQHFTTLRIRVSNSVLDCESSLFYLADFEEKDLTSLLRWIGTRNHHRAGTSFLRTFARKKQNFHPLELSDFEDFQTFVPAASMTAPSFHSIIDRQSFTPDMEIKTFIKSLGK